MTRSRSPARPLVGALFVAAALAPRAALAACPDAQDPVCEPFDTALIPGVAGVFYAPRTSAGGGPWLGAGGELVLFTWASNSDAFGPGHGKLRFDVEGLASMASPAPPAMVLWRGGVDLSLERNASRRFLLPFVSVDVGGLHQSSIGSTGFADAGLGLWVLYTPRAMIDAEAAWVFPFTNWDAWSGFKAQLTASVAVW